MDIYIWPNCHKDLDPSQQRLRPQYGNPDSYSCNGYEKGKNTFEPDKTDIFTRQAANICCRDCCNENRQCKPPLNLSAYGLSQKTC